MGPLGSTGDKGQQGEPGKEGPQVRSQSNVILVELSYISKKIN